MSTTDRPTIFVDQHGRRLEDPGQAQIGIAGPLGRERIVSCLPFNDGPRLLVEPAVITDQHGHYLADPDGSLLGRSPVWVQRMLSAGTVADTRRLG